MTASSSVGSACGKWILFGEHFVVHGAPALAWPLPTRSLVVTAHVRPGAAPAVRVAGNVKDPGALRLALRLLGRRLRALPGTLHVGVASTLPAGAGLGSSAALVVAMTDALHALGVADGHRGLPRLRALERVFHAAPSGLDTTVVSLATPVRFASLHDWARIQAETPPGVLVLSGETRATAVQQQRVASSAALLEPLVHDYLAVLAGGLSALARRDWDTLGRAVDENHALLARLGVVTPAQEALRERARDLGALGAKISGAGGGGAVLVLHPDPAWLALRLQAEGRAVIPLACPEATHPS
jgi:mevalonate kinase